MITSDFKGLTLPLLGFGAMRLPTLADGRIDEKQTDAMVDYALAHGVNYFDTAYPYHGGESERVIGRALQKYPRDAYYLATKYPGHQVSASYDPADVFEKQLKKCGTDYFDFYLLHNVCENSLSTYLDPKWGIMDYFREQKRLGRIRHLGFSSHGRVDMLRDFLAGPGADMAFCQIQLNYLDWTLQDAKGKYDLLTEKGIPVWVMEPVRGGKLAKLPQAAEAALRALRPDESAPAWAFRFLQGLPNVKVVLSGMSDMRQLEDNAATFEALRPLTGAEEKALLDIAEGMKNSVPCTACRYCCEGCPKGLDIPLLLSLYNELRVAPAVSIGMHLDALPEDKKPAACVGCGKCAKICPQGIDIPQVMKDFSAAIKTLPSWAALCRERERLAKGE